MYPDTPAGNAEPHLFTNDDLILHTEASTGQRFLNFMIDAVAVQYGLSFLTASLVLGAAYLLFPGVAEEDLLLEHTLSFVLISCFFNIVNITIYYTFCEKVFGGRTLGKLITGTKAVRTDGSPLSLRNALLRSLSRMVPFEPFSGFGDHPWHDTWTDTMVIRNR
ncbi:MAG: hypothetical protein JWP27_1 [Flaviaesturariibacter sp.]|nr:hypothetical protein [Flaviaesturariibacter sp.]